MEAKPSELFDVDMSEHQVNQDKRQEIEAKLKARQNLKKEGTQEHGIEKDPNEDYNLIDQNFTKAITSINADLPGWK